MKPACRHLCVFMKPDELKTHRTKQKGRRTERSTEGLNVQTSVMSPLYPRVHCRFSERLVERIIKESVFEN